MQSYAESIKSGFFTPLFRGARRAFIAALPSPDGSELLSRLCHRLKEASFYRGFAIAQNNAKKIKQGVL